VNQLTTTGVFIWAAAALWAAPAAYAQQQEYDDEELEERVDELEEDIEDVLEQLEEPVAEVTEPPDPEALPPRRASAYTAATWPTSVTVRPLTAARGMLEVSGNVEISFSSERIFEPISIAPDLYFGVTDDLTLGVTHSAASLSLIGAGNGLCLSGRSRGCPDFYNNINLEARYQLPEFGRMDIVLQGGFLVQDFNPFASMLRLGGFLRWTTGTLSVQSNPWIGIALTERDLYSTLVNIPVHAAFQFSPRLAAILGTGINGTVEDASDFWLIPLSFGVLYAVTNTLDVGATFGFPGVAGSAIATTDARALNLFVNYRLQLLE
jgi:hypothetical protein